MANDGNISVICKWKHASVPLEVNDSNWCTFETKLQTSCYVANVACRLPLNKKISDTLGGSVSVEANRYMSEIRCRQLANKRRTKTEFDIAFAYITLTSAVHPGVVMVRSVHCARAYLSSFHKYPVFDRSFWRVRLSPISSLTLRACLT